MTASYYLRSASIDITPASPAQLAGFSSRTQDFDSINDPLELNILLLGDGNSEVALVSADLLYIGDFLRKKAEELLYPILPEAILFAASHTHFAPATEALLPGLGETSSDYLHYLEGRLAVLVEKVRNSTGDSVCIKYFSTGADHATNRRRKVPVRLWRRPYPHCSLNYMDMLPNPEGVKDETVHAVGFYPAGQDNRKAAGPLAIFWSYACHPVCSPDTNAVSADFPGVVRQRLRQEYGKNIPVLFLQGFTGDIRPRSLEKRRSAKTLIRQVLAGGNLFGRFTKKEWDDWSGSLANHVAGAFKNHGQAITISGKIRATGHRLPVSSLQDIGCDRPPIHFQRISWGNRLHIFAISAEPVTEISRLIPETGGISIPTGYTDHTFGYLPDNRVLAEGGYEAGQFRTSFSLPGEFVPDIEKPVRKSFELLMAGHDAGPEEG